MTARPRCPVCNRPFNTNVDRGKHIRAEHPEHKVNPGIGTRLLVPARGPRPGGSLKRETDTWPGRA